MLGTLHICVRKCMCNHTCLHAWTGSAALNNRSLIAACIFTEEMFTYNREATKEHTLSSFIEEPSINEQEQFASDEENDNDQNADFKMPELDDADQGNFFML